MAGGEAGGEDGFGGVDGLREEVGGEREGADCVEHLGARLGGGALVWWVEVWRAGCMGEGAKSLDFLLQGGCLLYEQHMNYICIVLITIIIAITATPWL